MEEVGGIVELPDGRTVNKTDLRKIIKDKKLQISLLEMDLKQAQQDLVYILEQEGQKVCGCGLFVVEYKCDTCGRLGCSKCIKRSHPWLRKYKCDGIC
jgi:hypothetical protein